MAWRARKFGPKITKAEFKLRWALDEKKLRFLTQWPLKGREREHLVDFYFPPDLVVEVNGSSHVGKQLIKDEAATADLENAVRPFTVLRFKDPEIWKNLAGCVDAILAALTSQRQ